MFVAPDSMKMRKYIYLNFKKKFGGGVFEVNLPICIKVPDAQAIIKQFK